MMGSYRGKNGTWECDWPKCTQDSDRKFKEGLDRWYDGMAFCHYHLEQIHKGFKPTDNDTLIQGYRPLNRERVDYESILEASVKTPKKRITITAVWYDFWIGFYWDKAKRRLYILPVPMLGVCIQF